MKCLVGNQFSSRSVIDTPCGSPTLGVEGISGTAYRCAIFIFSYVGAWGCWSANAVMATPAKTPAETPPQDPPRNGFIHGFIHAPNKSIGFLRIFSRFSRFSEIFLDFQDFQDFQHFWTIFKISQYSQIPSRVISSMISIMI